MGVYGKPPENAIFPPAALRVSAGVADYTENSSFPYMRPMLTSAFHASEPKAVFLGKIKMDAWKWHGHRGRSQISRQSTA
jgi:hypothetical protein